MRGYMMNMRIIVFPQILVLTTLMAVVVAEKYSRPSFCQSIQSEGRTDEKSFLWRLRGREPPVYFFGTIHVPYTRVWSFIPENVKRAFQEADSVYFELDLIDPYTIAALAKCQMLPSGENLSDLLPLDVYQRLKRHLDYVRRMMPSWLGPSSDPQKSRPSGGLYADYLFNAIAGNWERKRPVWIMLMVNSLTESDIKARGIPVLDLYLAQEAHRMEKHSGAVEKVDEQCVPLNGLNFTQVLFALNQTLVQQENLRSGDPYPGFTTDDLIKHYNCGDLDSVYLYKEGGGQVPQFSNASLLGQDSVLAKDIDQYFKNELVHKRNARMAERVVQLIGRYPDESFFFAFGAGHFLGNNTVLDYVSSRGFHIEQVPPDKRVRSTKKDLPQFRHRHRSHHHHHSHHHNRGDDLGNDLNNEDFLHLQGSRLGRRRYRKRQNHHHHSVHLLRTSTSASSLTTKRTFNDLWIKIENIDGSLSNHLPEASKEINNYQDTLRAWYGHPNSSQGHTLRKSYGITIFACLIVSSLLRSR